MQPVTSGLASATDRRESGAHRREQFHPALVALRNLCCSAQALPRHQAICTDPVSAGARMAALEQTSSLPCHLRTHYRHWDPKKTRSARASGIVGLWRRSACPTLADAAPCSPGHRRFTQVDRASTRDDCAISFPVHAIAQQSSSGASVRCTQNTRARLRTPLMQHRASRLRALCHALAERVQRLGLHVRVHERLMLTDEVNREKKLVQYVLRR